MAAKPPVALFRRILKLHRNLPEQMRYLGDKYVKSEFQQHSDAGPEFVPQFMNTWRIYVEKLEEQTSSGGKIGFNMGKKTVSSLSEAQMQQVRGLKDQVSRIVPKGSEGLA